MNAKTKENNLTFLSELKTVYNVTLDNLKLCESRDAEIAELTSFLLQTKNIAEKYFGNDK